MLCKEQGAFKVTWSVFNV